MFSAVYYPHSTVRNKNFLKNALLMWDRVECIVPPFGARTPHMEPLVARATELLVRPHVPTDEEQRVVQRGITEIVERGIPSWFRLTQPEGLEDLHGADMYRIYGEKLASETWSMLRDLALAQPDRRFGDYAVPHGLGLYLMSLLADACAGTQKRTVTDRADAYTWLTQAATASARGEYDRNAGGAERSAAYERLIPLAVRVMNTDGLSLRRLIELREREETEGAGTDLRVLRHNYRAHLDRFVDQITAPLLSASDRRELERQYMAELRVRLRDLQAELGYAWRDAYISKEMVVTVAAAIGVAVPSAPYARAVALTGGAVGIGTMINKHAASRRAIMRRESNPMSWLYVSARRRWSQLGLTSGH